jgi:PAS domain S-box-containing protein
MRNAGASKKESGLDSVEREKQGSPSLLPDPVVLNMMDLLSDAVIYINISHTILWANQSACALYGKKRSRLIGSDYVKILEKLKRNLKENALINAMRSGKDQEDRLTFPGGEIRRIIARPLFDDLGEIAGAVEIVRETEYKNKIRSSLQEMDEKYRLLFANASEGIITLDMKGRVQDVNKKLLDMTGYTYDDIMDKGLIDLARLFHVNLKRVVSEFTKFVKGEGDRTEWLITTSSGKKIDVVVFPSLIKSEIKNVGLSVILTDVTEQRRTEQQIRESLKEKELLLKEIHHRVKNNLQIISSLLKLQADQIDDEKALSAFKNSRDRIHSMALVHERLYTSKDLHCIDFSDYVKSMVNSLFRSYSTDDRIALEIDVCNLVFGIDKAIPCGLILNELISNSLKHAFPDDRKGRIKIRLNRTGEDKYRLIFHDDGIGLPAHFNIQQNQSLGLHLVRILTRQLNGDLNVDNTKGVTFTISFQAEPVK